MTYEHFLDRLRATPRGWRVTPRGLIRTQGVIGKCPITAVSRGSAPAYVAADEIGLGREMAERIMAAADGSVHEGEIRRDLLKACGLAETQP